MQLSKLTLEWRTREGGGGKTHRNYLDFIVDGLSLRDRLPPNDQVSALGWGPATFEREAIAQLLLRAPSGLPTGRVPLYVCPECGDLDCGTISVRIEKTDTAFVWSDFAWENPDHYESNDDRILQPYKGIGPLAFHKTEYWNVLNEQLYLTLVGDKDPR